MSLIRISDYSEFLLDHKYNPNGIYVGATVDVCVGEIYTAIVSSIRLDSKNKKIYAHLSGCASRLPTTVDVADRRITTASKR